MTAIARRVGITEKSVGVKQIDDAMSSLKILADNLLIAYSNKSDKQMSSNECKIAQSVIKQIELILHQLELISPGVSNLQPAFNGQKLSYVRTLLAKASEVWSVIKKGILEEKIIIDFSATLLRIKDTIYIQTNNKTWDWASSTNS